MNIYFLKGERIREGESKTTVERFYALHTGKDWTPLLRLRGVAVADLPPEVTGMVEV